MNYQQMEIHERSMSTSQYSFQLRAKLPNWLTHYDCTQHVSCPVTTARVGAESIHAWFLFVCIDAPNREVCSIEVKLKMHRVARQ